MTRARVAAATTLAFAAALPISTAEARFGDETLRRGDTGRDVKTLQRTLTRVGYRTTADGEFGRITERRVRSWERSAQRRVDGKVTPSDARALKAAAPTTTTKRPTERATVGPDGLAVAPASAPQVVKDVIAYGNEIAKKPYKYGGGHGDLEDSGYDCSGSISYALRKAGLMESSMPSGAMARWGVRGRGQWMTVYANSGHAFMTVAGIRFDTSARKRGKSRWTAKRRSASGYRARHSEGL